MTASREWIVLAHLLRPQGRKGELLAELYTDFPNQFKERESLYLEPPDFNGGVADARVVTVESFWLPMGKNEGRIVLQLAGSTTIEDAERLSGLEVITPREDRIQLPEDESYISDLVGCALYDREIFVGTVADVQFATTADGRRRLSEAAPLLLVTSSGDEELLVPFVKAFLVAVSPEKRRIDMVLPEGLLEVNQGPGPREPGEARSGRPRRSR